MRLRRRRLSAFLATASRPATTDGPEATDSGRFLFECLLALLLRSINAQCLELTFVGEPLPMARSERPGEACGPKGRPKGGPKGGQGTDRGRTTTGRA